MELTPCADVGRVLKQRAKVRMNVIPTSSQFVFVVNDRFGNTVRLSKRTYEFHLRKRPYISQFLEDARTTLINPGTVFLSTDDAYHFYKFGLVGGKYRNCYVHVIVHYQPAEEGSVAEGQAVGTATFWLDRANGFVGPNKKKGRQIWPRR